ncbi:ABC transporter ATP-binding protein [Fervidibacillus albus]|uniref:ABC transporter ATP-binding protein n=1 Tax=Fervidibacillus albus TaxID=2980026 RepID=A0A9E8LVI1_9BACI|nr:ABC transporter ATP-binding protein [Fervidibacillus albus]WAA09564.1 ABC transporter ATP-binding protein [Fervidibacillus albus]
MNTLLKVSNISKDYPNFSLNDINLEILEGDIMGLIGENGAGKTTLFKLILNLTSYKNGTIELFGKNYKEDEKFIKNKIGIVLDQCHFHELLNPQEIGRIFSNIYDTWDKKSYASYLERFNLPIKTKVGKFSKGMKVKLSFAVALSHKPKLLLLDEATSGLDPIMRVDILDTLKEYVIENNSGVLIATHILSDVERIANKLSFLHKGDLVFSEYTSSITKNGSIESLMEKFIKGEVRK